MHLKGRAAGLAVNRETIRLVMETMDPEGLSLRAPFKLNRRKHIFNVSIEIWNMEGYDKLKLFGFAVHEYIDGFSRNKIWIRVLSTNSNLKAIASYFTNCLNKLGSGPKVIRADRGSENIYLLELQRYVRQNDEQVFRISAATQRLESCGVTV